MTAGMALDINRLIIDRFGDVDTYAAARSVSPEVKRQWRRRGVPLSELASVLLLLETDSGSPVSIMAYSQEGLSCLPRKPGSSGSQPSPFD